VGGAGTSTSPGPGTRAPGRFRSVLVLILVVILGAGGTTAAAVALRRAGEDRAARALSQQAMIITQIVTGEVSRSIAALTGLAAAVGAQARLGSAEFTAVVAAAGRDRLPGASGVALVVPATRAQIPALRQSWRARGNPGLILRPDATAGGHLFVVLESSLDGGAPTLGRDLAGAGPAAAAMSLARQSRRPAMSGTYRLLDDQSLPVGEQQLSFTLTAPVFSTAPADTGRFRGWLTLGLRGSDFLHQAISVVARDLVAVTLFDAAPGPPVAVASWQPPVRLRSEPAARDVAVAVPQRTWRLLVQPTRLLLPGAGPHPEVAAWLVGAVLTALLAGLTGAVLASRRRALRRADAATAALLGAVQRRETVEQQLRDRESELAGFAGVVAHDLRGPLARITGYADFLRHEADAGLSPLHRDSLERLHGGAQRMQALIDDLLDYAVAESRELNATTVDLKAVADEIADRWRSGAHQPPALIVVDPLPAVPGDATLLRQVFDHLISNAINYTAPGRQPYVRLSSRREGDAVRIDVADRGIGIPADQRDSVFTAFTRADGSEDCPGCGLGLAVVHRVVERHGGEIGVIDNPGGGSRVWFTLPLVSPPARRATVAAPPWVTVGR
jgi:signal transduction histidine kinase